MRTVGTKLGKHLETMLWDVKYNDLDSPGRPKAIQLYLVYDHLLFHTNKFGFKLLPQSAVYFTHIEERFFSYIKVIKQMRAILVMSDFDSPLLLGMGLPDKKVFPFPFGADLEMFSPDISKKRDIDFIFSLRYQPDVFYDYRKNYTKILHLATLLVMHNFKVVIVGPGWKTLKGKFDKRIDFLNIKYESYGELYSRSKFYLSMSNYEGGPLSLIEAMMCGAYPIVTQTGFSVSVLSGKSMSALSETGIIIPTHVSPENIFEICRKASSELERFPHKIRERGKLFDFQFAAKRFTEILSPN